MFISFARASKRDAGCEASRNIARMATTELDEIDSGGHSAALTVETEGKQA